MEMYAHVCTCMSMYGDVYLHIYMSTKICVARCRLVVADLAVSLGETPKM